MKKFPVYRQLDAMDCGPTCLRMIAKYYGKHYSAEELREKSYLGRNGTSLLNLSDAAEKIGFRTMIAKISSDSIEKLATAPFVVHWQRHHFVVVVECKKKGITVADPALGLIKYTIAEFLEGYQVADTTRPPYGVALLLEPTKAFYEQQGEQASSDRVSLLSLATYLKPYKRYIAQLFLGILIASLLQLVLPLLTQALVDIGINEQNLSFVNLILIGQLTVFISRMGVEFIRSWLLVHIGSRISLAILSDFLLKLMRLPISFFASKQIGDIMQRVNDQKRIETFLTTSIISIVFSVTTLLIFSCVLLYYSTATFLLFIISSTIYAVWNILFMKMRRVIDYKMFSQSAENSSSLIQLVMGMTETKLNGVEQQKRWEWERVQMKMFRLNMTSLSMNQYQEAGSMLINEIKNILITYLAARAVIKGEITLGMMISMQYIIGQINAPIIDVINFIKGAQNARMSLERLDEIHSKPNEDAGIQLLTPPARQSAIILDNVSFQYDGGRSPQILSNIQLEIPPGKVTAIVGSSGSGKSTLLKLLLKFYRPTAGLIKVGSTDLHHLDSRKWRDKCGVILQDSFIYDDTIARNVAVGHESVDYPKLIAATQAADIYSFIESLALNFQTKIGVAGAGLSQGQTQRILLARAIYRDPDYLFFDEATSALDASTEHTVIENLKRFFSGRTVVIVAHRLSTVVNADQIVVLENGRIVERGTHHELSELRGRYFSLVRHQLELA